MSELSELEKLLRKKRARKAVLGGWPKLVNIPRNWLHQAFFYMDTGERSTRILVVLLETFLLWLLLSILFPDAEMRILFLVSFLLSYTWIWVTNGLFWSLMIFTFPGIRNPGAINTVNYLNRMRERLAEANCISGISIYGSVTRGEWHERSDIDIRFLRRRGFSAMWCAVFITMAERFRAFLNKQPMDLFLADDVDFLKKMRSDEIPLFTLCRDERLQSLYPGCSEREIRITDLLGER